MKNYLQTMQEKINRYQIKYTTKPFQAYLRLTFVSIKYPFMCLFPSKKNKTVKTNYEDSGKLRIAFCLYGGLGDMLVSARYLRAFKEFLDVDHVLDIYTGKHIEYIKCVYLNQNIPNNIYQGEPNNTNYDLIIDFFRLPKIRHLDEVKISSLSKKLTNFCDTIHIFSMQNPVIYGNYPASCIERVYAAIKNVKRKDEGDIENLLNLKEMPFILHFDERKEIFLAQNQLESKKFITVQRGISASSRDATRLWPMKYYEELIEKIKNYAPQYKIVQIGTAEAQTIHGVDYNLCGKTSLEELKIVLKHSLFHIDGDTGTMHMRHALGEKNFVIWGPTDKDFIGYEEDFHFFNSPCPHACDGVTDNWNDICLKSNSPHALCMHAITPQMVFDKIKDELNSL